MNIAEQNAEYEEAVRLDRIRSENAQALDVKLNEWGNAARLKRLNELSLEPDEEEVEEFIALDVVKTCSMGFR